MSDDVLPPEDLAGLDEFSDVPPPPPGTVHCAECTILIGPGFLESEPFQHPSRPGVVCGQC